jgi:hypothetical protein
MDTPKIELLVDNHKHRIAKRGGNWWFYCPMKGPDNIIYYSQFRFARTLLDYECPHWDALNGYTKKVTE